MCDEFNLQQIGNLKLTNIYHSNEILGLVFINHELDSERGEGTLVLYDTNQRILDNNTVSGTSIHTGRYKHMVHMENKDRSGSMRFLGIGMEGTYYIRPI